MTPDALADRHPHLFHLYPPDRWESLREHGLWPTWNLLEAIGLPDAQRLSLTRYPRPHRMIFPDTRFGDLEINDNSPLSHAKLRTCLDGMSPEAWCELLSRRVFFWADETRGLARLAGAKRNQRETREVIVIDTTRFARAYADKLEISPLNSGSTIRRPAFRGRWLFTPLTEMTFEDWSRLRQKKQAEAGKPITQAPDRILEVVMPGIIPDIADYVTERRLYSDGRYDILPL